MAQYRFLYNLNKQTFDARRLGLVDPAGYLLSIHRYTEPLVRFACALNRDYGEVLMSDNGFFERIRNVISAYEAPSAGLLEKVKRIEKKLGRPVRPGEIPDTLRDAYRVLAARVEKAVYDIEETHAVGFEAVLSEQARISPDRQVAPEDIFLASLVGLNIEPEYLQFPRSFFRRHNQRSARFYKTAKAGAWGAVSGDLIGVASAVDYNSAFDAGREMARAGARFLAIGTGAYMVDQNFTDHYKIGRKTTLLKRNVPRRYARTVLTAQGLLDGYLKEAGRKPKRVHFLGLGTPIMMLMAGWVGRGLEEVSFDATSPIKDAVEGTIYLNDRGYLKARTRKLAAFYADSPQQKWECACAYCQHYQTKYKMNASAAGAWRAANPSRDVEAKDLATGAKLAKALPLFSEPSGGALLADISDWRAGHNHMMLEEVMQDMNSCKTQKSLRSLVEQKVRDYCADALPHYAYALESIWNEVRAR